MKCIHIIPSVANEASGPTYSVTSLCHSLMDQDNIVTLVALDHLEASSQSSYLKTFPVGFGPKRLGRSPAMKSWLFDKVTNSEVEVLHNHGMWHMSAIYPAWAAKKGKVKLIQSPRGALTEWAMNWGSRLKPMFWKAFQLPALRNTACFHATAESECEDIRRLGFTQPIALIPNGIDIPIFKPKQLTEHRTLLFLGRIHFNKGLDLLLYSWREIQHVFPNWRLKIVGNDDGYLKKCLKLVEELSLERIDFVGPLYGDEKLQAYRNSDLFVLPSYSENFAMSVAESLSVGTPAVVSMGAPWAGLEQRGAGWWIDLGVEPLVACLRFALSKSHLELLEMGNRGREWMMKDFCWNMLGSRMSETYQWLINDHSPIPEWVITD